MSHSLYDARIKVYKAVQGPHWRGNVAALPPCVKVF